VSWFRALKDTSRSGLSVERKRLEPLIAVRGAAGLAIVIAMSLWLFGPVVAAGSAFGAFQAAIATFQRSWRPRPQLAFASGASLGISTFVGYITHAQPVLFLLLLALWTFMAGLSWAAGPTIGIIASSNVAMMLVTVTLPTSVAEAAAHAAMMIVGGLVQAALVIVFPIRRWGAQRDALADALAAEADYARRLRHDPVAPFDPEPLMLARSAAALTPRQARTRPAQLRGTRGLAERIRPVLASLADPAVGAPEEGPERDRVRELLQSAGSILDAAARAIRHGRPVTIPAGAVSTFRSPDTGAILTGPAQRAAKRLGALLRDVVEAAGGSRHEDHAASKGPADPRAALRRPSLLRLAPAVVRAIRREVRPGSAVLRHAYRVTAVGVTGYVLGALLPLGHGYWAPMSAVMVMRPDFSQTYSRAVGRFAGTLIGVAVATAVVRIDHPGTYTAAALAVGCAGLMYLLMRTGQLAAQACIAAYVVFLLGMGGESWDQTVFERVVLTLAGGLLAMLSYALYPAWETPRLRNRLADWLSALGEYTASVAGRYAYPAGKAAPDVRDPLLKARDAHIAWEQAFDLAKAEPVRSRGLTRAAADDAAEALHAFGRAAMLLEAHLPERGTTPVPAAGVFAEAVRSATRDGAKAIRERRVPRWTAVREALDAWDGEGVPDRVVRSGAGLLMAALDELSEALDTEVPAMSVKERGARDDADDAEDAGDADGTGEASRADGPGQQDGPRGSGERTAR
jgi:uncharacterized membrane protein YccC